MPNSITTVGLLCTLATACGGAAPRHPQSPTLTAIEPLELRAAGATPAVFRGSGVVAATTSTPSGGAGAMVALATVVDRANCAPGTRDRVPQRLSSTLAGTGYEIGAVAQLDRASEAFILSPTIERVSVVRDRAQIKVECRVQVRIAPWRGGERWEPGRTATVTSTARATTGPRERDLAPAMADCLDAAIESVANGHVVPFLRRIASR